MKRLVIIDGNALDWADRGSILAMQIGYTTISIGHGFLPKILLNGFRLDFFTPVRPKDGDDYKLRGFQFRLLPSLSMTVGRWPKWYRFMHSLTSYRNYDCCSVICWFKCGRYK